MGCWTDLRPEGALESFRRAFEAAEKRVHAFVEEPGRFERLAREVERSAAGSLAGVPIGVKDIFHVDGLPTRAGSRFPAAVLVGPEAESVRRLRAAGAIVVGKTATTEFAYFAPAATRNPHDSEHTPGGSSSGSAAAIATGQCVLALGTQTIGSVGRPAAFCGVVGFKPTWERISREGVIPLSPSLDHVGVFAPNVAWARRAAALLCDDWTEGLIEDAPRLGVPDGPYLEACGEDGRAHFDAVVSGLEAAGLAAKRIPCFADFDAVRARHRRILAAEAAEVHAAWRAEHEALYRPQTLALLREGEAIDSATLEADLDAAEALAGVLEVAMEQEGIDLWISPAAPGPAPHGLASTGDPVMNLPWTQSGLPTVVVPSGWSGRLPLGTQLAARRGADEALLGWAGALAEMLANRSEEEV